MLGKLDPARYILPPGVKHGHLPVPATVLGSSLAPTESLSSQMVLRVELVGILVTGNSILVIWPESDHTYL